MADNQNRFNLRKVDSAHEKSGDGEQTGAYKQGEYSYDKTNKMYDIVAAIDFGTSTTGCAYSTASMFKKNPLDITCEQIWNEQGYVNQYMAKTKTCLLYDKEKRFISFGYDAEYMYADFRTKNEHENYRFFHNFKMDLYNSKIPLSELMLMDVSKKTKISAKMLFSDAILAVTMKIFAMIKKTEKYDVEKKNFRWVLTVPAIWSDDAKYFMRECACQAGIHNIVIALEPEAASIFCNHLRVERANNSSDGFVDLPPGTKYMVVDIGGGTTDITVHEKQQDGTLTEINKASGDGIGGVSVDDALLRLVNDTFVYDVLSKLNSDKPNVYLDLYYDIEKAKRSFNSSTSGTLPVRINYVVFNAILKSYFNSSLSNISEKLEGEDLQLDANVVKGILKSTADSIMDVMEDSMKCVQLHNISMIIMVGGFANCEMIQHAVKERFSQTRVIVPEDAGLAILFGAVIYGHNTRVISHRFTQKTYGVAVKMPFDKEKHAHGRKCMFGGVLSCEHVFSLIIRQNEKVSPGTKITKEYWSEPNQKAVSITVYTSSRDSPVFCDDPSCRKIGTLKINYPHPSPLGRDIEVDYIFGDTELFITAREKTSNIEVETRIILD